MLLFLCTGFAKEIFAESLQVAGDNILAPLLKEKCGSTSPSPCSKALSVKLGACVNRQSSGSLPERMQACVKVLSGNSNHHAGPSVTASGANDVVPDAMKYMVKAPDVDVESMRDPFISPLAKMEAQRQALLMKHQAQTSNRKREALEAFDLSELKLVAILSMRGKKVAMIEDNSGKGYMVRRNNYIGKNGGRIEKISKDSLHLIENIPNPAGDLVEREVVMTLKEVNE